MIQSNNCTIAMLQLRRSHATIFLVVSLRSHVNRVKFAIHLGYCWHLSRHVKGPKLITMRASDLQLKRNERWRCVFVLCCTMQPSATTSKWNAELLSHRACHFSNNNTEQSLRMWLGMVWRCWHIRDAFAVQPSKNCDFFCCCSGCCRWPIFFFAFWAKWECN